jgi:hypothetical protein
VFQDIRNDLGADGDARARRGVLDRRGTADLVLAQKLLPENRVVDLPLAAAIVALGVLIIVTPTSVPA